MAHTDTLQCKTKSSVERQAILMSIVGAQNKCNAVYLQQTVFFALYTFCCLLYVCPDVFVWMNCMWEQCFVFFFYPQRSPSFIFPFPHLFNESVETRCKLSRMMTSGHIQFLNTQLES